jgi:hypothetical protein
MEALPEPGNQMMVVSEKCPNWQHFPRRTQPQAVLVL